MITGRLPTIPEYWAEDMHKDTDLMRHPMQPCPFHYETEPSFSYSRELGVASCFGKCKARGMDVIEMHRRYMHFNTRDEAEDSLRTIHKCKIRKEVKVKPERLIVNTSKVEFQSILIEANMLATTVERWLELDYAMSKYPVEPQDIRDIVNNWKGIQ